MQGWDFEKPIIELEQKIGELRSFSTDEKVEMSSEIKNLENKLKSLKKEIYSNLTPWQKVQISRHPKRPTTLDYLKSIAEDYVLLSGDRGFGEDQALVCGFATIEGKKIAFAGHQKGKDTHENIRRNFGCAHPEGYRKAMRIMNLAERFGLPIVCFIDTPGAYPGIGAEERGQAQAIAENIRDMFNIKTPIVVTVIGEGGSGGALGIGVGDRVLISQYGYYSVISPEGCAAILWKDAAKREEAAKVLKLTAPELMKLEIVDQVIPESEGGAHWDLNKSAQNLKKALLENLLQLEGSSLDQLLEKRYQRFRKIGKFIE
ncbi:MAG: acetyl-CoA carboxylase carboxyltransferase subunit alpha [Candidatus Omnitrophica bacterium]|nr:acetyl-CoA carboxylase carboxyltransferase subunit alpha [Candidatus Omnitrophota bacterium]MCF7878881.1 acetyl-CoA carboxylase carboxyltransferase subunit alpha [Candidatus Omnitrophota bacterium]MCF7893720.1 acetyl-CoA carboxylase carboxyltransferase subunit alpha [Candidatus Omnitrophota bacterium]